MFLGKDTQGRWCKGWRTPWPILDVTLQPLQHSAGSWAGQEAGGLRGAVELDCAWRCQCSNHTIRERFGLEGTLKIPSSSLPWAGTPPTQPQALPGPGQPQPQNGGGRPLPSSPPRPAAGGRCRRGTPCPLPAGAQPTRAAGGGSTPNLPFPPPLRLLPRASFPPFPPPFTSTPPLSATPLRTRPAAARPLCTPAALRRWAAPRPPCPHRACGVGHAALRRAAPPADCSPPGSDAGRGGRPAASPGARR